MCFVPPSSVPSSLTLSALPFPLSGHTPPSSTSVKGYEYGCSIDSGRRLGDILAQALSRGLCAYGKLMTSTGAPEKHDSGMWEVPIDSVCDVERPGAASVSTVQMAAEPVSVSENGLGSSSES